MFASETDAKIAELESQIDQLRMQVEFGSHAEFTWLGNEQHGTFTLGGDDSGYPQCYGIGSEDAEQGTNAGDLVNCYIVAGGKVMAGPSGNVYSHPSSIVAVAISADYGSMSIESYNSMEELISSQTSTGKTIYPLYKMGAAAADGSCPVEVDYRNIPRLDVWAYND